VDRKSAKGSEMEEDHKLRRRTKKKKKKRENGKKQCHDADGGRGRWGNVSAAGGQEGCTMRNTDHQKKRSHGAQIEVCGGRGVQKRAAEDKTKKD